MLSSSATAKNKFHFVSQQEIIELTGLSLTTLKRWRRKNQLVEGVHWVHVGKQVRFNLELFQDWLINGKLDPQAHSRAIQAFQESLLSNQPKRVGRPSKTSLAAN